MSKRKYDSGDEDDFFSSGDEVVSDDDFDVKTKKGNSKSASGKKSPAKIAKTSSPAKKAKTTNTVKESSSTGDGPKSKAKSIEERYQKKSQLEHILLRPDSYVGSLEMETQSLWIWDDENKMMIFKTINFVPGLYKIFDEILVNAADVKAREVHEKRVGKQKMTKIEVTIDEVSGIVSVLNDGLGIPIEKHKEHHVYVPELIFGHLLTSDNYDDTEKRVTGGRNGYGAKLTNIFSSEFSVECVDSSRKRKFKMVWNDNMSKKSEPMISDAARSDYVKVTFKPDFARLKISGFDSDILALFKKRVYDMAGTTGCKVYLNGNLIPVDNFKSYVDLYFRSLKKDSASESTSSLPLGQENVKSENSGASSRPVRERRAAEQFGTMADQSSSPDGSEFGSDLESESGNQKTKKKVSSKSNDKISSDGVLKIYEKTGRWEVVVAVSDGQFQQVSFVNSICTSKGGTHVNHVVDPLITAILKKVNSKNKGGMEIKSHHVKNHMFVFVNCLIENPTFDSQTKIVMTLKPSQFGSKCELSEKTLNAVVKSPIVENVLLWAQTKQQVEMKKKMKTGSGRGGRDRVLGIPKLDDANDAGTKHSASCTLILTEGDSAKTSCLAGLSVVGRDRYGVYPLRGKLLNVRDASFKALTENKEIQDILKITGLEVGRSYDDCRGLRYGNVVIMTDQDHDGSHIKGLILNLLHQFWPSLLKVPGFVREFVTPIIKASKKDDEIAFFTLADYQKWLQRNGGKTTGWKVKYYKGLGTSSDKEFKEYFSELGKHMLEFEYQSEQDFESIDMAFNAKRVEDRKKWINSFDSEIDFIDHSKTSITYSDFINKELVLFSKYDNERSIPCVLDGWKPGQRKVLFAAFKKNLVKSEMKVAQFASFVAEHTSYHHGEESLAAAIVNMAQTFVGSGNNLNVLEPCGQFGSRKEGGKDASATRYIYTRLTPVARKLFVQDDEELLSFHVEEGRSIEPKWYIPVIPLLLANGAEGIGTGWSCNVPCFNPRDIIANIRRYMKGESMVPMKPWFRGFKGTVEVVEKTANKTSYEAVGTIHKLDDETLRVTELPVRVWTQAYKEFLEELVLAGEEDERRGDGETASNRPASGAARGKRGAAAKKAPSRGGANLHVTTQQGKQKISILDYRDNSTHESVDFTLKLTKQMMDTVESAGLEKVFRLRKPIPMTNMTVFAPDGTICKYESELDILREFGKVRLEFYHKRKQLMMTKLERAKCLVSNKMRFLFDVVENRIIVAKRKKADLISELFTKGFDTMTSIDQKYQISQRNNLSVVGEDGVVHDEDAGEQNGDDNIVTSSGVKANDFDYLLNLSLWNLTYEKIEDFKKQLQDREQELDLCRNKTVESLWSDDLDGVLAAVDEMDEKDEMERQGEKGLKLKARISLSFKPREVKTERKKATAKASAKPKTSSLTKELNPATIKNGPDGLFASLEKEMSKSIISTKTSSSLSGPSKNDSTSVGSLPFSSDEPVMSMAERKRKGLFGTNPDSLMSSSSIENFQKQQKLSDLFGFSSNKTTEDRPKTTEDKPKTTEDKPKTTEDKNKQAKISEKSRSVASDTSLFSVIGMTGRQKNKKDDHYDSDEASLYVDVTSRDKLVTKKTEIQKPVGRLARNKNLKKIIESEDDDDTPLIPSENKITSSESEDEAEQKSLSEDEEDEESEDDEEEDYDEED